MGEKVIVPEFVADWYEQTGKYTEWFNWFYKWGRSEERSTLENWVIDWMQDFNEKAFVDMFHNGYEIEKEQLFYVLTHDERTLLLKKGKEVQLSIAFNVNEFDNESKRAYQLTKKEIESYDERFMVFAVKVEEFDKVKL